MEPGLGQGLGLGLESLPRLAGAGRPVRACRLGTVGSAAGVGAAAATPAGLGAGGQPDVEPDCELLGILEQRNLDSDLIGFLIERSMAVECYSVQRVLLLGRR